VYLPILSSLRFQISSDRDCQRHEIGVGATGIERVVHDVVDMSNPVLDIWLLVKRDGHRMPGFPVELLVQADVAEALESFEDPLFWAWETCTRTRSGRLGDPSCLRLLKLKVVECSECLRSFNNSEALAAWEVGASEAVTVSLLYLRLVGRREIETETEI